MNILFYLSEQTNNVCPVTGKKIASNYCDLKFRMEKCVNSEDETIPTYVPYIPTNKNDNINQSVIFPNGEVSSYDSNSEINLKLHEVTTDILKHKSLDSYTPSAKKVVSAFLQWHYGNYMEENSNNLDKDLDSIISEIYGDEELVTEFDRVKQKMIALSLEPKDVHRVILNDSEIDETKHHLFFKYLNSIILDEDKELEEGQYHLSDLDIKYSILFTNSISDTGYTEIYRDNNSTGTL